MSEVQMEIIDQDKATDEDRAKDLVSDFYQSWIEETDDLREKWKGIYNISWVFKKLNAIESQNKTLINKAFENIQSILPRLYSRRPSYQLFSRKKKDNSKIETTKALLDYQWTDYDLDDMFYEAGNWFLTYGTHIIRVGTDIKVKSKSKKDRSGKKIIENYVARDTQGIEHIPIWRFIIDPKERDIQKAPGIAYFRKNVLVGDLEKTGFYRNLDKVKKVTDYQAGGDDVQDSSIEEKTGVDGIKLKGIEAIETIVHYYGLFKPEGADEEMEYIITIAGQDGHWTLIQMEENFYRDENKNPYRPFVDFHNQKDPHMFYSIGEVEQIMGLQAVLNTLMRQRIDAIRRSVRNKWIVQQDSVVDETAIVTEEDNAIIEFKDGKAAPVPVRPNDITGGLFSDMQMIMQEINNISGITDFTKGGAVSSSQTATVAALNAEAGNQRLTMKLRNLQRAIKGFIRIRLNQNRQFFNRKQTIRILKEGSLEGVDIPPFPLADVDIIIEEGSTQLKNSIAEQQRAAQLTQVMAEYLQMKDQIQTDEFVKFTFIQRLEALNVTDPEKMLGIVEDENASADVADNEKRAILQQKVQEIEQEHLAIMEGQPVDVLPSDDHVLHMKAHADFLASPQAKKLTPEQEQELYLHLTDHEEFKRQGGFGQQVSRQTQGSQATLAGSLSAPSAEQGLSSVEGEGSGVPADGGAELQEA